MLAECAPDVSTPVERPACLQRQVLTGSRAAPTVRSVMQARDAGQTGFVGYYFSYRLPGGPMP